MRDAATFLFHWLEYIGLLGGLGSLVVRRLGRMRPQIAWDEPPMHYGFGAALLGGLGLLAVGPSWLLAARVLAEGAALVLCLRGIPLVAPFALAAIVLLPVTGHAASVQSPAGAELDDAVHVLSAAMWAGGILALASLRPPGGWRGVEALALLQRFGRVAVIAFGVTALTGVIGATEHLGGLGDLWTSTYGLVLALKTAGVLVMLAASLAWRRGLRAARVEGILVALVVAATALLATLPPPNPAPAAVVVSERR